MNTFMSSILKFKVAGDAAEAKLTRIKEGQQQRQQPTQAVKGMGG